MEIWRGSGVDFVVGRQLNWEVIKHSLDVRNHVYFNCSSTREIEVHSKVFMVVSAFAFHFTIFAIFLVQPFVKTSVDFRINVTGHEVVDMESNSVLLSCDGFVCNARIVRVKFVSDGFKVGTELLVPEKCGLEHAI